MMQMSVMKPMSCDQNHTHCG